MASRIPDSRLYSRNAVRASGIRPRCQAIDPTQAQDGDWNDGWLSKSEREAIDKVMGSGMTPGEVARYVNGEYGVGTQLRVVPVEGWERDQWWDETGLEWVNPSPNIRRLEAAIHYPGTVFLEGTNLSEGRGSDLPFEQTGAPWLRAENTASAMNALALPGVRFEAVRFEVAGESLAAHAEERREVPPAHGLVPHKMPRAGSNQRKRNQAGQNAQHLAMVKVIRFPVDLQIDEQFDKIKEGRTGQREAHGDVQLLHRPGDAMQHRHQQLFICQHDERFFGVKALRDFFLQYLGHQFSLSHRLRRPIHIDGSAG